MTILVAEEEPGVRNLLSLGLKHQGYSAEFAEDTADATIRVRRNGARYCAVMIDLAAPGAGEVVEEARRIVPVLPVIGLADNVTAVDTARVQDVLVKPLTGESLRKVLQRCLSQQAPRTGQEELTGPASDLSLFSKAWGREMLPIIRHVAASDVPVLVRGETGSGKEVLARQLHTLSLRAKRPFLKVNCAALPSELIESELFGYERGAFTGAFKTTPGKFEMADHGTILLDEIGDMDFKLQAKLLQVLQDGEFIRLGSAEPRKVNVRVMAATHCDLETAIEDGRFREDLYYRLNVITIHVPALRDRTDEILSLASHFMQKYANQAAPAMELTPAICELLLSHDWPGNVRELENMIRKLLVVRRVDYVAQEMRRRSARLTRRTARAAAVSGVEESSDSDTRIFDGSPVAFAAEAGVYGSVTGNLHDDMGAIRTGSSFGGGNRAVQPSGAEADNWSVLDQVDYARREAETEAILAALNSTLWNRKRAAELLNIDYKALLYKMKKLGIVERASNLAM